MSAKTEAYNPKEHFAAIDLLHRQQNFALPHPGWLSGAVVVKKDEKVVGFGMTKIYPEAFIMIDQELSTRDKVDVLRALMSAGIEHCKESGFDEIVVFVSPEFAGILEKHLGFSQVPAVAMSLKV